MITPSEARPLKALVLIAMLAWFAVPGQAYGQWLVADPYMGNLTIGAIQPGLDPEYVPMTDRQTQLFDKVLDRRFGSLAQLQASRELLSTEGLPYAVERWATMKRIVLAAGEGLPDEVEEVAYDWLKRYPDSLEPLPAKYRAAFPHEPDINMNLRVYLAHMYLHLASDTFNWPEDYRYARVQELMAPLLEEKRYMSIEELDARVWFAERCRVAEGRYMRHLTKAVEAGEIDEEMLPLYAALRKAESAVYRAKLYESVASALENAFVNPDEYRLVVDRPIPEHMILAEIESVSGTALDCRRVAEKAKEQLSGEPGGPGAQLVERMWEALSQVDG
ncbi:MAG: hypothetical protein JXR94_17235 [Candidatus Hydrogenedentes bacterium]|nr:hypothetical protein [Candidatus Hydrogenedentota bacterium]